MMGKRVQPEVTFDNTEQPPDLDAIVAKWRPYTVPADVDLHIKWGDCDGAFAECRCIIELNRMFIVVAPADYVPENHATFGIERDIEADVLHELCHWDMEPCKPEEDGVAYRFWEAAVEKRAQGYLRMDRGN